MDFLLFWLLHSFRQFQIFIFDKFETKSKTKPNGMKAKIIKGGMYQHYIITREIKKRLKFFFWYVYYFCYTIILSKDLTTTKVIPGATARLGARICQPTEGLMSNCTKIGINNYPVSSNVSRRKHINSPSRCWLSIPELSLEISRYKDSS